MLVVISPGIAKISGVSIFTDNLYKQQMNSLTINEDEIISIYNPVEDIIITGTRSEIISYREELLALVCNEFDSFFGISADIWEIKYNETNDPYIYNFTTD